jgi:predicted nucleic acid-binding protein
MKPNDTRAKVYAPHVKGKRPAVPYDEAICDVYAELKAELSAAGYCVESNDLWIAACAVRHSIPLITNNRSHFENIPRLSIISELP